MPEWYGLTMNFTFKEEHFVKSIYQAFAKNGYVEEATHFLYTKVKEMQSTDLNAFYDRECIMGFAAMMANKAYDTVEEGRYVTYTTNGDDRHCRQMSGDTVLGKALMGHKKDDEVPVVLEGQTKTVKIIGIHNQYYYLHYTNMQEVMESGGNAYFTPFPDDLKKSLEAEGTCYLKH